MLIELNKIQLDEIIFRSEHCKATNQDCKDLIEHIQRLTGDLDCEGSLLQKIADNIGDYVDVDFDVCIDKTALKRLIDRNK